MKVLLYGINYAPELTGIGKYTGELATWLAHQGHEVRVVTAPPYYPEWRVGQGYSSARYQVEQQDGITIYRCPLWIPTKQSGKNRLAHLASFALSSLPAVVLQSIFWRPDLLFVVEPTFFCTPGALAASRLSGARTWLHIQDFEIDAAFELGLLRAPLVRKAIAGVERAIMGAFDRVSAISPNMLARVIEKGCTRERAKLFPNWVDTRLIRPDGEAGREMRRALEIPDDALVALYSGNMGEKQGLDILVDVAKLLEDAPRLLFVLCGEGAARKRLEASSLGLPNVRFLPLQPLERLNGLLNMADVHLLPQRAEAADLVLPSKLTGILASGRPVVATARPGTSLASMVESAGGIISEPGDAQQFASALRRFTDDPRLRAESGLAARQLAECQWSTESILAAFERDVCELLRYDMGAPA